MPSVSTAIIASSVVGAGASLAAGSMGASAARDAAGVQAASADRAAQTQLAMFKDVRGSLQPFIGAGAGGINRLQSLLGPVQLGGGGAADLSQLDPSQMSPEQLAAVNSYLTQHVRDALGTQYKNNPGAVKPGMVGGSLDAQGNAFYNPNAVNVDITQPGWSLDSLKQMYPGFDLSKVPGVGGQDGTPGGTYQDPSLTAMNALLGLGPDGPGGIQAALEATPGYQFTRDQGLRSVQNSYAAKGLASSGAALKGAAEYTTGLADTTYEKRLQDYVGNWLNRVAANQNLVTIGANAAAGQATVGTQAAQAAGNFSTSGGAATAAGIVGGTNALTSGITGAVGALGNGAILSGMYSGSGSGTGAASAEIPAAMTIGGSGAFRGIPNALNPY